MFYWTVMVVKPLVVIEFVTDNETKTAEIHEDKVLLKIGDSVEEKFPIWVRTEARIVAENGGVVVIKDFDDMLNIPMYMLKQVLKKLGILNVVWEKESKYEMIRSGSKCVKTDSRYRRDYLEVKDAYVLFSINFPEYYHWYPFRDERVYTVLNTGEVYYRFTLDNGERFCYDSDISELIDRVVEAVIKPKKYETWRGNEYVDVVEPIEIRYYDKKFENVFKVFDDLLFRVNVRYEHP